MAHDYDIDMLKENDQQIERADSNDQTEVTHDVKFEKRVLRKIDTRLLPILGCLYTIALVDRSNVAVARISGMDEDLDLTQGNRVSVALMVFFIGYILFEIPSNAFIHKLGAANWLAFLAVAWGLVSLGIGFLNNWIGLAVLRAFLGVFEAGFFPGCVYLVSSWYKRYEVQKRMAGFFLTASALSAFANILAYGLIQISKTHHYKGWRWIFIIEGTITVVAGIGSWFIIVDFPDSDKNTFLTVEERAFVKARLAEDRGPEEHEKVTWKILAHTAADWKPWAYSLMYMAGAVGVYAFLFFLPIILRGGLGYSIEMSFILSTPPALFSVVEAMTISWLADKLQMRGPFVIFQGLVGIIGLCMTAFLNSPTPRYIGTFLGVAGANGLVVTTLAWQANNIVGDARRAVSTGILISMSGVGGIYSSMVFRQQDAPNYLPGILAVMAINVVAVIVAGITMLILRYNNRQAEKGEYLCENREGFSFRYLRTTTTILRKHVLDHKATILLVHGAWHRSWAWNHQIPELESLGYPTTTVDLPSTSGIPGKTQLDDVKHVQATLEQMIAENKDVVVLAHSYGGPIGCGGIVGLSSQERAQKNLQGGVVGFINLCGYIFPGGMDQGAIIESVGGLLYVNWDTPSPGLFVAKDPGSMLYQPDVPKDLADWALTQLQPQSMAANLGIVPPQAWQDDSYRGRLGYIKATADAVIPIADQESMIDKSGGSDKWITRVLEGSGHSPMLSHPEEVARVVDSLIQDFQRNTI